MTHYRLRFAFLAVALALIVPVVAFGQANLTSLSTYTQNFDTLANTGTANAKSTLPVGWDFHETSSSSPANVQYRAGTGSDNGGDTYSLGSAPGGVPSTERAFGTLQSGSNVPTLGVRFLNASCYTITQLSVSYYGEQWRLGTSGRATAPTVDSLDFQYSLNATGPGDNAATWVDVNALDFVAPVTVGTVGALDGNANRVAISANITGLSIANGQQFWFRWKNVDAFSSDDALGIDDFSLTPSGTATTPTLSIADTSKLEGDAGTSAMTYAVTLDCPAPVGGVSFDIATIAGGTASAPSDYATRSLTGQTIAAGGKTYDFDVTINGDAVIESDETVLVEVSNVTGATAGDVNATGTISNDDSPPNLSIADVAASETNSGTTNFTFTVQLSAPAKSGGVTFDIATSAGTATAGEDFALFSASGVNIPEGSNSYQFNVQVNGDAVYENDETFNVTTSAISGANVVSDPADRTAVGTISNDDAAPQFSIGDVTGLEGSGKLTFSVTASAATEASITIDVDTADASATDADDDYEPVNDTITFDASSGTVQTVEVTINDNGVAEGHEHFLVNLSNATAGTLTDDQANGIILEDDPISLTAVDTAYGENFDGLASSGSTGIPTPDGWTFIEADTGANFTYAVNNGAANGGNTYSYGTTSAADRALGALGSGSLQSTFGASFRNDTGVMIETLMFELASEQWRAGVVDSPDTTPFEISTDATSLTTGTWTAFHDLDLRSVAAGGAVGARDGNLAANRAQLISAIAGLAIAPGETFWIRWSDADDSGSDDGLAVDDFAITANTTRPLLSIDDVLVTEGAAGTQNATFTVSLSQPAPVGGVTFRIATADGIALAGSDYVAKDLSAQTIAAGNTSYTFTVLVNGDVLSEPSEDFFVRITDVTGTDVLVVDAEGRGVIVTDDLVTIPIHDVQGSGYVSPYDGATISVDGVVTGIKPGNGFFLQESAAEADGDLNTSEAIFVYTGGALPADVVIGNRVAVTGTVDEFPDSALPDAHTEMSGSLIISLLAVDQPLPEPVAILPADGAPSDNLSQFERFEDMRVTVDLTVVAPTNGNVDEATATSTSDGVFYGVVTGVARPFREPGIDQSAEVPSDALCFWCIPSFDSNPEKLRVDSDRQPGTSALDVVVGQTVTGLVGVLDQGFFEYTILPEAGNSPVIAGDADAEPVRAPLATELTVASLNVERFFNATAGGGDAVLTPAAYADRLEKLSHGIREILLNPAVLAIVEVEDQTTLAAVAARVDADNGGSTNYDAWVSEGNDIGGIDVGFLVDLNRVTVDSVTQVGKTTMWTNPHTGLQDPNPLNDRPPLVLEATALRPDLTPFEFVVIVNHLRSLNGIETDDASGQRVRAKRAAQAEFLADYIQTRQENDPAERLIAVGDFNAFQFSDGYVDVIGTIVGAPAPALEVVEPTEDLVNPNLTNLVESAPAGTRNSYSFDGDAQVLDHALVNAAMLPSVNGFEFAHLDADFPEIFRNDKTRPERISDHDATVTYLDLSAVVTPQIAVADASVTEADTNNILTFTVMLDVPATAPVTVQYSTAGGTAASGTDFLPASGGVSFAAGEQVKTLDVTIVGDNLYEPGETFVVNLSTPTGATIADGQATGTIINDDTPVADLRLTMSINPDPPQINSTATITLVITNYGPDPATDVEVTDDLPSEVTLLEVNSTQGDCTLTDPVVCSVGTLGAGQAATITILVKMPGAATTFTNAASASANEDDSTPAAAGINVNVVLHPADIPAASELGLLMLMAILAFGAAMRLRS